MHQRFMNPHMQHQHMVNRQNSDPRFNINGGGNNQPPNITMMQIMTPNGPMMVSMQQVMTPNGPMLIPVQQNTQPGNQMFPGGNMMPMQGNMNMMHMNTGMMPMNTGMPNVNRFGTPTQAVNNGLSITSTENDGIGNRYQQMESIGMQEEKQVVPELFTVNIQKNITFDTNSKVVLNTYVEEIKSNNIKHVNESFCLLDCFEEAVECIIENANNEENTKIATIQQFMVNNSFYKTVDQAKFNEFILDNDIKGIYKALKTAFPTLSNKYDINLINSFDTILTDYINDFVKVNAGFDVSIDSFMTDFNDLLKVVRNNEEDLEDNLIAYMDNFINNIKENIDIMSGTPDYNNKNVYIPENYSMCYVDKFSYELGINHAYNKFVKVDDNIANTFINSLSKLVFEQLGTNNFYLITIDKFIVKMMINISGNIFIKKIG